jgi:hypothetical protein
VIQCHECNTNRMSATEKYCYKKTYESGNPKEEATENRDPRVMRSKSIFNIRDADVERQ